MGRRRPVEPGEVELNAAELHVCQVLEIAPTRWDGLPDDTKKLLAESVRKIDAGQIAHTEITRDAEDKRLFDRDFVDPMLSNDPLKEAVERHGAPGMAPKFLSPRCLDVLGMRGYEIVKDEHGDPVKVGTLIMGQIPQRVATARQEHYAEESRNQIKEVASEYQEEAARVGARAGHARPLEAGEVMEANATEEAGFLGQKRGAGVTFERE